PAAVRGRLRARRSRRWPGGGHGGAVVLLAGDLGVGCGHDGHVPARLGRRRRTGPGPPAGPAAARGPPGGRGMTAVSLALAYGVRAAARRHRLLVLPAVTVGTG